MGRSDLRLLAGVVGAPTAASYLVALFYVPISAMLCCAPITDWLSTGVWILLFGTALAVVALGVTLFAGIPVHVALMRLRRTNPFLYIVAATLAGAASAAAIHGLVHDAPGEVLPIALGLGALTGLFFWLIRRPDRDTHPAVIPDTPQA